MALYRAVLGISDPQSVKVYCKSGRVNCTGLI